MALRLYKIDFASLKQEFEAEFHLLLKLVLSEANLA
jgi:hypothetical protein